MNTWLQEQITAYLVTEENDKKIYHLPDAVALRIDLARLRKDYPQSTLERSNHHNTNILTIRH